ncbi:hypothetical protein [Paractinoplanes atraurantiacus]|uniref:TAP-like protein n=1 Tax=Paractinoplanes atraurantiacus TaxID=1036182 RepID=A0A285H3Q5_9ACTN|nr:hypothetical protein [Actinoplanes atraurantiacus]SNY30365.1 hypothetical protein SAMN05421748_103392 [Actinoplanes atraurantiacus]
MSARTNPRGQGSRFALSRLPVAAIIIMVMAAGVAIASIWGSGSSDEPKAASATTASPDPCEDARENCASLRVGGREWRYSLMRAESPTKNTAILDLGGPGTTPLSGRMRLSDYRSLTELKKYNLLVIEEPWVTAKVSEPCQTAATVYYNDVRSGGKKLAESARSLNGACQLGQGKWGFDADDYSEVVTSIAGKEAIEPNGFVGFSFGIARYNYLASTPAGEKLSWAVLARPFPVGTDATSFVRQRASLIEKRFGKPPAALQPASVSSRSLPVTSFDELSAIVGLEYAPDGDQDAVARAVTKAKDREVIGQYSDNLWHRYGTDSISPAYLAQLDELCAATTASDKLPAALEGHPYARVLAGTMLPCAGEPSAPLDLKPVPTCVVASKGDPVVAGDASVALIRRTVKDASVVESPKPSHQSQDGLSSCLTKVVSSAA